jgi:hypothetical protein
MEPAVVRATDLGCHLFHVQAISVTVLSLDTIIIVMVLLSTSKQVLD